MSAPVRPADLARIRALSIDLDDTLWAIEPVIQRAERKLFAWLTERYPRVTVHRDAAELHTLRLAVMDEHPDRHHDFTFLRREMLLRLARSARYPDAMADEAFAAFSRWRNQLAPFDDVVPALRSLQRRFSLVALTNGNADLDAIGLDAYFAHTVTARDVGFAKPDPRIFQVALERLGIEAQELLHIGDAPRDDIEGAHNAGVAAVWMNRFERQWPADSVARPALAVRDLAELLVRLDLR